MKHILLVRHAKSSISFDVEDFDRPLNERGKKDASFVAQKLKNKEIVIDAIVSSPAKRAFDTATVFAGVYNMPMLSINTVEDLYEPDLPNFYSAVNNLNNASDTVALFSHNPGITTFANELTTHKIDDMPTCSVFAIRAETESWQNFAAAKKTFWFFEAPKP